MQSSGDIHDVSRSHCRLPRRCASRCHPHGSQHRGTVRAARHHKICSHVNNVAQPYLYGTVVSKTSRCANNRRLNFPQMVLSRCARLRADERNDIPPCWLDFRTRSFRKAGFPLQSCAYEAFSSAHLDQRQRLGESI
jgi:hypothetical protein